jgi:two-component system response regulator YesN
MYFNNVVDMKGEIYRGIDIKVDYLEFAKDNLRQEELVIDKIRDIVETGLRAEMEEVLICEKENLHIYCLFNYNAAKTKKIFQLLSDILLKVKEYFMGLDQYEITIGIGTERTEFSEIRFSILEAYCAVCNRLKFGTGRLIIYDEMIHVSEDELERKIEEVKNTIYSAIESYSQENLNIGIFKLFDSLNPENKNIDMSVYFLAAEKLVELFLDYTELDKSEKKHLAAQILQECQHCSTISKMKKVLERNLGECLKNMRLSIESKSTKPIRIAKEYIEEHYTEKILLEDIAEIVELNPVYFSTLFKKETDTNFSTYLTQVRMEHAKELLVSTNDTVAAIGMAVGYDDQKYFSQVFKKVIGVKPAVYRKVHS